MKLDLLLTKRRTIIPATPEDAEKLRTVLPESIFRVESKRVRNGRHHRKLQALITFVAENHPRLNDRKQVERELKYRTGHFDEFVTRSGAVLWEPRSISYAEMDEGEFAEWSGRAKRVILDDWFPEMDEKTLDAEIARQMREWEAWQ